MTRSRAWKLALVVPMYTKQGGGGEAGNAGLGPPVLERHTLP